MPNSEQSRLIFFSAVWQQVPPPKDISDDELLRLLEAEDPSGFRIPMSLGEPHAELDKGAVSDILVVFVKP